MQANVTLHDRILKKLWKQRYLQAFVLIGLLFMLLFNYIPMFGLIMGFKDYKIQDGILGIFTSEWVGFKYIREFVTDYNFPSLVKNTLVISILKLVFTFPMPIIFAIMLSEFSHPKFKKLVQTSSYMPYFISWVIVSGFAVNFLNAQNGLVNQLLMKMGLVERPINFLTRPEYFWQIAVITSIWKEMGWWAIVFVAAIAGVNQELYEAAWIDGAGRLKRIWHVSIPGIAPTITVVLILSLGNLLGGGLGGSTFEQSYLLGNAGNISRSDVIQTYVFRMGLSKGRYAYATAVGMIQSVISVVLVFMSNYAAKKIAGQGLF